MRARTAHIHIGESALRILADAGYNTKQQAAAFAASPETIRRRRRKWTIEGEGRTMPALDEPCRECRGTDDVRLVRVLLSGTRQTLPLWSKARAMCRPCRREYRLKWKWSRSTEAREVERSLGR